MANDESVTLRMGKMELLAIDGYIGKHPEVGSRSNFIRMAVRDYVNRDADGSAPGDDSRGVFIRLTEHEMNSLDKMVEDGLILSASDFLSKEVSSQLTPREDLIKIAQEGVRTSFSDYRMG